MKSAQQQRSLRAFTIVEMLVVLSLVALLLAIILPSFSKAQRTARIAVCASNERQIGILVKDYNAAHFGMMPVVGRWEYYQQMMYVMYNPPVTSPETGWQNLGLLVKTGQAAAHSTVWFCPLQTYPQHVDSQGRSGHINYIGPSDLVGDDTQRYPWVNMRSGYLRRNLRPDVLTTTIADMRTTVKAEVFGQTAMFCDVISVPLFLRTGHPNSVNVLYGDGHVELRTLDPAAPDSLITSSMGTYTTANNPAFGKVWESFDR